MLQNPYWTFIGQRTEGNLQCGKLNCYQYRFTGQHIAYRHTETCNVAKHLFHVGVFVPELISTRQNSHRTIPHVTCMVYLSMSVNQYRHNCTETREIQINSCHPLPIIYHVKLYGILLNGKT